MGRQAGVMSGVQPRVAEEWQSSIRRVAQQAVCCQAIRFGHMERRREGGTTSSMRSGFLMINLER
jgi:hypothetical protein